MNHELDPIFSIWKFGTVEKVENLISEVWRVSSTTGIYVLKRKTDYDAVMRERDVLDYLQGCHVSAHIMLADYQPTEGQVYCQYSYITGETSIDDTSSAVSEGMGQGIGVLHNALKLYEKQRDFPLRDVYDSTFSGVLNLLQTSDNSSIKRLAGMLTDLKEEMKILKELPKQLIHRDAHGDNMVFRNGHLVGFLDFDLMQVNIRLFDPCYCAMGVLPSKFNDEELRNNWVKFLGDILRGYDRVNPLSFKEIRSIWYVVIAIEALFVAIFIKGSPEIAAKNAEICLWLASIREDFEQLQMQLIAQGSEHAITSTPKRR